MIVKCGFVGSGRKYNFHPRRAFGQFNLLLIKGENEIGGKSSVVAELGSWFWNLVGGVTAGDNNSGMTRILRLRFHFSFDSSIYS